MEAPPREPHSEEFEENGPPCKRCGKREWRILRAPKSRPRWLMEAILAAPDVLAFQRDSGGWPSHISEIWNCHGCGRRVRR